MANRKNTFIIKRSNVAGNKPSAGQILLGELAINTADVILYTSGTTAGSVLPIGWDRISRTGDTISNFLKVDGNLVVTGSTYLVDTTTTNLTSDYIVTNEILSGSFSGGTFYGDGSNLTGVTIERQVLDVYQSGNTLTNASNYSDIIWDVLLVVDSDYSVVGSELTFNKSGYYEVNYNLSVDSDGGGRKNSRSRLVIDSGGGYSEMVRSASYGYHRNVAQGKDGLNKTIKQLFSSGDKIKCQISKVSGGGNLVTVSGDSNITINKL